MQITKKEMVLKKVDSIKEWIKTIYTIYNTNSCMWKFCQVLSVNILFDKFIYVIYIFFFQLFSLHLV